MFAPIIVICVNAGIVAQINSLQVVVPAEVGVDFLQFVVIDGNDLQNRVAFEKVCLQCFNAVVAGSEPLEIAGMTQ